MNKSFISILESERDRIDASGSAKRHEAIIEGYTHVRSPKAIIQGKEYLIFNSNDYLGLRFHKKLIEAEEHAVAQYGVGPGAVRFISGTLKIYRDLEKKIAAFHDRDDAIIYSSAFAANCAVLSCFLNKQSKDSLLSPEVVVISDALNHRSIIDGIRTASIDASQKKVYRHLDYDHLRELLEEQKDTYKRAVVVSDGVFSMIGEYADIKKLREIVDTYNEQYSEGVLLLIDDSHGVGAFGESGRGCEEVSGARADVLIGTFGKAFGTDGGYIVGDQIVIDYLRESSATYIYSNPVSPSVAAAAYAAVSLVDSSEGKELLKTLYENVAHFKTLVTHAGLRFVTDSHHPIQPLLVGETGKTKALKEALFAEGILVTNITYPVVAKGLDEIRIQLAASHTTEDIEYLVQMCSKIGKTLNMLS